MEAALLDLPQQAKVAGSSASLTFTTVKDILKAKFKIIFTPRNVPRPIADAHHLVKVCALLLKQQRYQSAEIIFLVLFIRFVYHLTSLKPSMTHFTLAEGIFTRALQYNLYLLLW